MAMTITCSPTIPDVSAILPELLEVLVLEDPAIAGFTREPDSSTWKRSGEYDIRVTVKDWGWRELCASGYDHHLALSCNNKGHDVRTLGLPSLTGTLRKTPGHGATFHFVYCPEPNVSFGFNELRDGTMTCIHGSETVTRTGDGTYLRNGQVLTQSVIDAEYGPSFPFASDFALKPTIAEMVRALRG